VGELGFRRNSLQMIWARKRKNKKGMRHARSSLPQSGCVAYVPRNNFWERSAPAWILGRLTVSAPGQRPVIVRAVRSHNYCFCFRMRIGGRFGSTVVIGEAQRGSARLVRFAMGLLLSASRILACKASVLARARLFNRAPGRGVRRGCRPGGKWREGKSGMAGQPADSICRQEEKKRGKAKEEGRGQGSRSKKDGRDLSNCESGRLTRFT